MIKVNRKNKIGKLWQKIPRQLDNTQFKAWCTWGKKEKRQKEILNLPVPCDPAESNTPAPLHMEE